jgi:outer membrane lipoprotein SlyB
MRYIALFALILTLSTLTACVTDGQNTYSEADVGRETQIEWGRIVKAREVKIQGKNTGTGSVVGATAGGLGGAQIGNGSGSVAGAIGGVVLGAIIGGVIENQAQKRMGIEYTITKRNGKTVTIVQNIMKDDAPLRKGDRVMIQTTGSYMRVLPADDLPEKVKKPKILRFTSNTYQTLTSGWRHQSN